MKVKSENLRIPGRERLFMRDPYPPDTIQDPTRTEKSSNPVQLRISSTVFVSEFSAFPAFDDTNEKKWRERLVRVTWNKIYKGQTFRLRLKAKMKLLSNLLQVDFETLRP